MARRKEVWREMNKIGFLKKLVKLCRILTNNVCAKVKIGRHLSAELKVNNG
jgi:hypothetical protein